MLVDHINEFLMEEFDVLNARAVETTSKKSTLDSVLAPRLSGELDGGSMGLVMV